MEILDLEITPRFADDPALGPRTRSRLRGSTADGPDFESEDLMPTEAWMAIVAIALIILILAWLAVKDQRRKSAELRAERAVRSATGRSPILGGRSAAARGPRDRLANRLAALGGILGGVGVTVGHQGRGGGFSMTEVAIAGAAAGAGSLVGYLIGAAIDGLGSRIGRD